MATGSRTFPPLLGCTVLRSVIVLMEDVTSCHQVVTWRPSGNLGDTISQHFLGGGHALRNTDLVSSGGERYRLTTRATGTVQAQIHIVLRNFDRFGIEC